ncbi:MAG: TPM domain-containing protein [Planctomycetota bacterium]
MEASHLTLTPDDSEEPFARSAGVIASSSQSDPSPQNRISFQRLASLFPKPSTHQVAILATFCTLLGIHSAPLHSAEIKIARPNDRQFVLDLANILTEEEEKRIQNQCDKLLTDKATPIIVVTIDSMTRYGGFGMNIETFARKLFDQWGIGLSSINKDEWNTGILLIVSTLDRKARIELGAGWGVRKDSTCDSIMNDRMVPQFKKGNYAQGIISGVDSLDYMARELELPPIPRPFWHYAAFATLIGLGLFTAVSMARQGSSGWAWIFWAFVFSTTGTILYHLVTDTGGSSSSGGYSGGSFGGGYSGGGGSTGSW